MSERKSEIRTQGHILGWTNAVVVMAGSAVVSLWCWSWRWRQRLLSCDVVVAVVDSREGDG